MQISLLRLCPVTNHTSDHVMSDPRVFNGTRRLKRWNDVGLRCPRGGAAAAAAGGSWLRGDYPMFGTVQIFKLKIEISR